MSTWFITGASRGFGREVALEALRRGDNVVATARNVDNLSDLATDNRDRVLALPLDVQNREQITAAVAEAEARFGGIDVLFNNAGIGYFAAFEESDDDEARRLMEINVFGLTDVTKAVLPGMRTRRSGRILNVSSVGGQRAFPSLSWYHASKWAVEGHSEALAQEVAHLGIQVVIVEPSAFATDWAGNSAQETLPENEIADYAESAGEYRKNFRAAAGSEPGDPKRAALAIVDVAHEDTPPLRLPLGNYAYDGIVEHLDQVRDDIKAREQVSRGADKDSE